MARANQRPVPRPPIAVGLGESSAKSPPRLSQFTGNQPNGAKADDARGAEQAARRGSASAGSYSGSPVAWLPATTRV
jgi:hypothetical protein